MFSLWPFFQSGSVDFIIHSVPIIKRISLQKQPHIPPSSMKLSWKKPECLPVFLLFCLLYAVFNKQNPAGSLILCFLFLCLPKAVAVPQLLIPDLFVLPLILGFCEARWRQVNSLVFKWVRCLSLLSAECLSVYRTCCQWSGDATALMRLAALQLLLVLILNRWQQPFKVNTVFVPLFWCTQNFH